jgi:hypothetical protein
VRVERTCGTGGERTREARACARHHPAPVPVIGRSPLLALALALVRWQSSSSNAHPCCIFLFQVAEQLVLKHGCRRMVVHFSEIDWEMTPTFDELG